MKSLRDRQPDEDGRIGGAHGPREQAGPAHELGGRDREFRPGVVLEIGFVAEFPVPHPRQQPAIDLRADPGLVDGGDPLRRLFRRAGDEVHGDEGFGAERPAQLEELRVPMPLPRPEMLALLAFRQFAHAVTPVVDVAERAARIPQDGRSERLHRRRLPGRGRSVPGSSISSPRSTHCTFAPSSCRLADRCTAPGSRVTRVSNTSIRGRRRAGRHVRGAQPSRGRARWGVPARSTPDFSQRRRFGSNGVESFMSTSWSGFGSVCGKTSRPAGSARVHRPARRRGSSRLSCRTSGQQRPRIEET